MAQGTEARRPVGQQTVYLRKRILGANGNITNSIGFIPAGSNILRAHIATRVVFSGGTPAGTFGTRAAPAGLTAAVATQLTTLGNNTLTLIAGVINLPDVDTEIVLVQSGAPTAGIADVTVEYIPPDETP